MYRNDDLSYLSRNAIRKRDEYRSLQQMAKDDNSGKLAAELVVKEKEMHNAIFDEIIAQHKDDPVLTRYGFPEIQPRLKSNPQLFIKFEENSQFRSPLSQDLREAPIWYENIAKIVASLPVRRVRRAAIARRPIYVVAREKRVDMFVNDNNEVPQIFREQSQIQENGLNGRIEGDQIELDPEKPEFITVIETEN